MDNFDFFKDEKNNCYQIRTKNSVFSVEFDDDIKENLFLLIANFLIQNKTIEQIKKKIGTKENNKILDEIINLLIENELINNNYKNENYYSKIRLGIIGNGLLTSSIYELSKKKNFLNSKIFSFEKLNDNRIESIVKEFDFLIVDSSSWSPIHLQLINKLCIRYQKKWLLVNGIEEFTIKIGPLFDPTETGCYECFNSRIKSNHSFPELLSTYEEYLIKNKSISKPDQNLIPGIDLMIDMASNVVIFEIIKLYSKLTIPESLNHLIVFNLYNYEFSKHYLLRKPFCEVCKPKVKYNSAPWLEKISL